MRSDWGRLSVRIMLMRQFAIGVVVFCLSISSISQSIAQDSPEAPFGLEWGLSADQVRAMQHRFRQPTAHRDDAHQRDQDSEDRERAGQSKPDRHEAKPPHDERPLAESLGQHPHDPRLHDRLTTTPTNAKK